MDATETSSDKTATRVNSRRAIGRDHSCCAGQGGDETDPLAPPRLLPFTVDPRASPRGNARPTLRPAGLDVRVEHQDVPVGVFHRVPPERPLIGEVPDRQPTRP